MGAYFDIAWRIAAWVLVAAGAGMLLWALAWDATRLLRPKHRATLRRCAGGWGRLLWVVPLWRGCWYDLSGVAVDESGKTVCPECGRSQGGWRVKMPRVRWGVAALGLAVVVVGLAGRYGREVHREGWAAVPTWALVLVPFNERDLIENGKVSGPEWVQRVAAEIDDRGPFDGWAGDRWAARVEARYRRDGALGVDAASREAFERLAQARLERWANRMTVADALTHVCTIAGVECRVDEAATLMWEGSDGPLIQIEELPMSAEMALDEIGRLAGFVYVGTDWTLRDGVVEVSTIGTLYFPPMYEMLDLPRVVLEPRTRWTIARPRAGETPSGRFEAVPFMVRAGKALDAAMITVNPGSWAALGGAESDMRSIGTSVLVASSTRDILRVRRVFEAFDRAQGLEPDAAGDLPLVLTTVHDLGWLRRLEEASIDQTRQPVEATYSNLVQCVWCITTPDFWYANGGDRAMTIVHLDRLIVHAPPAMQAEVASLLGSIREANEQGTESHGEVENTSVYPAFPGGHAPQGSEWRSWLYVELQKRIGNYGGIRQHTAVIGTALVVIARPPDQAAIPPLLAELRRRFDCGVNANAP